MNNYRPPSLISSYFGALRTYKEIRDNPYAGRAMKNTPGVRFMQMGNMIVAAIVLILAGLGMVL